MPVTVPKKMKPMGSISLRAATRAPVMAKTATAAMSSAHRAGGRAEAARLAGSRGGAMISVL
jgi:hypothetical protein